MRGWIPREEEAMGITDGTTKDIALIARAGKPVCFRILRISQDETGAPVAILSRRAVREECWEQYLSRRRVRYSARHGNASGKVRGVCGHWLRDPSLLPIDTISVSRISHPATGLSSDRKSVRWYAADRTAFTWRIGNCWEHGRKILPLSLLVRLSPIIRSVESWRFCGTGTQPCRTGEPCRRCCCRTVCQRLYQGDPAGKNEGETDSDRHICPD
ncbi:MAG: hypothetical protein ACLSFT_00240 [Ruminococcus callidus]